jgi:o-succinylbenzoate synthase
VESESLRLTVKRITLTHCRVPLVEPFRISSGAVAEKDGIVVRVETEDLVGHGESSPMSGSFYSSDTPESCWRDLGEQLIPAVMGRSFDTAQQASKEIHALPGSNFARAGLETAFWDIEAQRENVPLWQLLGGTPRPVESGLAVGLYDRIEDLLRTIERYLPDGYKRVKIKIERGRDVELVRAVRKSFGDIPLFVDANGA